MASIRNQKGVALVIALVISVAIMALVTGVLYFVTQSTTMSGAGKRYATADDAADGAIHVLEDTINLTMWGQPVAGLFPPGNCLKGTILGSTGGTCSTTIQIPGLTGPFTASVTVQRLYSLALPGGRLEFARSGGGVGSTAIYFKITSQVTGSDNSTAENSALYRFAG